MRYSLLVTLILMVGSLYASPLKVDCQPRTILLGDVITYRVMLPATISGSVQFDPGWPATGNLTLLGVTESVKPQHTRTYFLTAFTLDKTWAPALSVHTISGDYVLDAIPITVKSSFAKNERKQFIKNLKPQASLPIHWGDDLIVLLLITLLVAAVIFLYRKFVRHDKTSPEDVIATLTPYELAMKHLDKVQGEEYLTEEAQKRLMFELSHILRQYLETVFNKPFMEETTYEIGYSLPQILEKALAQDVIQFLQDLDPVKYAKGTLSINELKGRMIQVRDLLSKVENRHAR